MLVGDLVRLVLDDSIGIIYQIETVPAQGVYDNRIRYWIAWQEGSVEWTWEEEVEVVSESR